MATDKKVALITGANKGLGLEIARQLGNQGIVVVIGSRDAGRGEAAAQTLKSEGIDADFVKLEVTNADDIAALPAYFERSFGRLDILVNNAGVIAEHEGVTPDVLRQTYEANVIAPYALTQALLPLLKASPTGRIVNQSSYLGSLTLECLRRPTPNMASACLQLQQGCLEHADGDPGHAAQRHARQSQCRPPRLGQNRHEPNGRFDRGSRGRNRRHARHPARRRPDRRLFPPGRNPALVTMEVRSRDESD